MELNCINPKTYALTQNQPYTILDRDGNYVYVTNDKGKVSKYHSSLFEEQAPPTPARTEQDCINSIQYVSNTLAYTDMNHVLVTRNINLELNSNDGFSCGIVRIEGINNLSRTIDQMVDTTNDDHIPLKKALFAKVLQTKINSVQNTKGMWMCSTNQNGTYEDYHNLLDEFATHNSGWFRNHNSGNQIKLWYGLINNN